MKYKKYVLKSFPSERFPQDLSCFQLREYQVQEDKIPQGFALIRVYWISEDPLLRTWISGARSYLQPAKIGSGIPGFGVAKIIKLNRIQGKKTGLQVGDWVVGILQWSQLIVIDYKKLQQLPSNLGNQQYKFLTVYGPTGLTSFLSIKRQIIPFKVWNHQKARFKTAQEMNIVISSVAGGVGLTVVEYLSKFGYKNIYGIAGSEQKCRAAKSMGCKEAIDYKKYYKNEEIDSRKFEADLKGMLKGQKIDIYYENVGEDMLSSMLKLMADHSRIVMCGATATYNNWRQKSGVKNMQLLISKRIEMKGILYFNLSFNERVEAFLEMLSLEMKGAEIIIKGIQKLPETYRDMIDGKFIGKPLVQLVDGIDDS